MFLVSLTIGAYATDECCPGKTPEPIDSPAVDTDEISTRKAA